VHVNVSGHHWIRDTTRLRIYLRDFWCCVWCGRQVKKGTAHLDHVWPRGHARGTNRPTNLVTSCHACNEAKGDREPTIEEQDRAALHTSLLLPALQLGDRVPTQLAEAQPEAVEGQEALVALAHPAA